MSPLGILRCAVVCAAGASAAAWADADTARNRAAAWLIKQQRGDGSWASGDGGLAVQATSASILALKNGGLTRSPSFGAARAWLANADADSVDAIARKVEALAGAGHLAAAQREADRLYSLRTRTLSATWGGYGTSGVDHIDTALGLTALRAGDANYLSKVLVSGAGGPVLQAFCDLVTARIPVAAGKKAWASTPPATSQSQAQGRPAVVATALLTAELHGMNERASLQGVSCGGASFAAVEAEAVSWLLDQQNGDGGFGEQRVDGSKGLSNVLVTAWVHRTLTRLAAVPQPQTSNASNWLLAQQDSNTGSWRGDALVTASVVAALPVATGAQAVDSDRDGVTDVVEAYLGTNPTVADAVGQLGAPTLAASGVTTSAFAVSAVVGQVFSYALGTGSGFSLATGSLPPGLELNTLTGQISGAPTQAGSYSFEFRATAANAAQLGIGRIDVIAEVVAPDGEVPIPAWALVALGGSFLAAGWRQRRRQAQSNPATGEQQ
jgi:hypothetical protein